MAALPFNVQHTSENFGHSPDKCIFFNLHVIGFLAIKLLRATIARRIDQKDQVRVSKRR